ncbi:MAG: hypothetical protein ABFD69_05715 [Candidatus Sumerlaeia bacterium]
MILIGIPALFVCALKGYFAANAVRGDLVRPPADVFRTRPAAKKSPWVQSVVSRPENAKPLDYDGLIALMPNRDTAALYRKLKDSVLGTRETELLFLDASKRDEQARWLAENRDVIEDILKLADAGGLPGLTWEQAMSMDVQDFLRFPLPDLELIRRMVLVLAAETRRAREAGDDGGALRAVCAIDPLTEPLADAAHVYMPDFANIDKIKAYQAIEDWLQEPPPREILAELRDKVSATNAADYRGSMELQYRIGRRFLLEMLEGPLTRVMACVGGHASGSIFLFIDDFQQHPVSAVGEASAAAVAAVRLKGRAREVVLSYDANFRRALADYENGTRTEERLNLPAVDASWYGANWWVSKNVAQARRNLVLAGLDESLGAPGACKWADPFTSRPLCRVEETTATLFYSIGPDRADTRAAIGYDPTNGTFSGGDIFLRIPKPSPHAGARE